MTDVNEPHVLDLMGLKCPMPVLKTRKTLAGLSAGSRLEVLTTDPMAFLDIPHMCNEDGHTVEKVEKDGTRGRFFILKTNG
ncbi:sulfurtransferase TusA family protein [Roseibium litorale]|uniref:Sulfurtransferase TusA family protein n=1 Tax=Roseibium litorale TaxID=2803841 RepID=A0ABR9CMM0_9HYPH|nr:sulfurtransferase TusA family protein [Roseibium litorale]MBD8892115.1 sulfurtransferase TusA family protein [Roseibium litorale]